MEPGVLTGLVDFHCHLDLYDDPASVITECERHGVYTLAVTTTPRAWPRNKEWSSRSRFVHAALGLHPQLVAERSAELPLWEQYLPQTRYVGEVGLDASPRFFKSLHIQKHIFKRVLRSCADQGGKILSVHSVRTAGIVLDLIEAHLPPDRGRVVLHWFTGSAAEARRAVELGCFFSVNAQMLRTERSCRIVESLPAYRLLTETDGPFTTCDNRPARPADIIEAVEALAGSRNMSTSDLAGAVRANLRSLLA